MHSKNQRRHGSPSCSRAPLVPVKAKMSVGHSEVEALPFRVPHDYPHSRFNKAPLAVYPPKGARAKACVSVPVVSLEKMPCLNRSESAHIKVNSVSPIPSSSLASSSSCSSSCSPSSASLKSGLASPASHKNQEKLLNGRGPVTPRSTTPPSLNDKRPSPSRSPMEKRPAASPSSLERRPPSSTSPSVLDRRLLTPPSTPDRKHQNGAMGVRNRRVSGRIFDPNKHCGVVDPETKRSCTRSLTCKTHSLTHRRAVQGRKQEFDILLAEHKGRAKEVVQKKKDVQASSKSVQVTQSRDAAPSLSASCPNGKTTPTLKLKLSSAHIHRVSGSGGAVALSSAPVPPPEAPPSWQKCDARLSSDDGEADPPEESEKLLCHYSPHHPRPMSCCAFSSRLMGRGQYVFDRRWDRVRLALHCMVEKHVNSLMWRKVPLMVESLTNDSPSPTEASPLNSSFLPNHTLTTSVDGDSMVSYSSTYSQNGAGVFRIRDPETRPKPQRTKPAKPLKVSGGPKRRKPPPNSEAGADRKSGISCDLQQVGEHFSNGSAELSVRAKPRPGAQGSREARYGGAEFSLGNVSSQGSLSYSSSDERKRKGPGSSAGSDKPSKTSKSAALDAIFRKSHGGLWSSVADPPHCAPFRQPKVPH